MLTIMILNNLILFQKYFKYLIIRVQLNLIQITKRQNSCKDLKIKFKDLLQSKKSPISLIISTEVLRNLFLQLTLNQSKNSNESFYYKCNNIHYKLIILLLCIQHIS